MSPVRTCSRREVVRSLAWMLAGVAGAACTPLRIITRSFPAAFKNDPHLVERTLHAFAGAVIPGADHTGGTAVRALLDPQYPFAAYAGFFASDLAQRAFKRYGAGDFGRLTLDERTAVISEGLAADATTRKLYRGAIYLSQVAFYAGIYDDAAGCPAIAFHGFYRGEEISYGGPEAFLPAPHTANGNCA